jgi:beta-glucanase (GH16 family)
MNHLRTKPIFAYVLVFLLVFMSLMPVVIAAEQEGNIESTKQNPAFGSWDNGKKNNTAPLLDATAIPGSEEGTTKITLTNSIKKPKKAPKKNYLAIKVSSQAVATPNVGDKVPNTGTGVINPYNEGNDINGVDTITNKYVAVYEANHKNEVVEFKLIILKEENIKSDWSLVWSDEFNDTTIDLNKWTYDLTNGAGGWGNNELEYYTNRPENVREENGALVITAKKEEYEGFHYTSTRIKTKGKYSQKYGKFEIKAKAPAGKGYWPAIWMLPEDNVYGTWAASGEIDIMEGWGSKPNTIGGTIHYGQNWPNNTYTGKEYVLPGSTIEEYHVYSLEWEPGEMRWYVDGHLYSTQNDWYSKSLNQPANNTYPAPFDQPFHLIMNLAVGGNFDGNPDDTTLFPKTMEIDYVRMYELTGRPYLEPVTPVVPKEDLPANARMPLPDGNLVYNNNFDQDDVNVPNIDNVPNTDYWTLFTGEGGAGHVIVDNMSGTNYAKVNITSAGNQPYSVQLLNNVSIAKGRYYKLSFDAKSTDAREMSIKVTGGAERGFVAYSPASTIALTNEVKHYELSFQMKQDTDIAARTEFNVGLNSKPVWIGQVRLEEIDGISVDQDGPKTPLDGDGNHVYNGTFDQGGPDRMMYWHVNTAVGASATPSVDESARQLKVAITNGGSQANEIQLLQKGINLIKDQDYQLTFDAQAVTARSIEVELLSKDGTTSYGKQIVNVDAIMTQKSVSFSSIQASDNEGQLIFHIGGTNGDIIVDNVKLIRTSEYMDPNVKLFPLINGGFDGTLEPWQQLNVDGVSTASLENGEVKVTILNEGTVPWGNLFIQENLNLSNGVNYTVEFDARSTIDRQIEVILENASFNRYFDQKVNLTNSMTHYKFELKMTKNDLVSVKYLLGKLDGASAIGSTHDIYFDNVVVEVKGAKQMANKLTNGTFDNNADGWLSYFADFAGVFGTMAAEQGQLKTTLNNNGGDFWHAQVEQENITLEKGKSYMLTFDARSTLPHNIQAIVEHKGGAFTKYATKIVALTNEMKTFSTTFTMTSDTDAAVHLDFALGKIDNAISEAHDVYVDNVSLVEVEMPPVLPSEGHELLNGTFDINIDGWQTYLADGSNAIVSMDNGQMKVDFPNYDGWFQWSTQVFQDRLKLESGKTYQLKFDASSTINKDVLVEILTGTGQPQLTQQAIGLIASTQSFTYEFTVGATDQNSKLAFLLGSNNVPGENFVRHSIYLDNITLMEKTTP